MAVVKFAGIYRRNAFTGHSAFPSVAMVDDAFCKVLQN